MYYSANWQLLEEHIDYAFDETLNVDRRMQYIWDTRGSGYIDDIVVRREHEPVDLLEPGVVVETWFHLTDTLSSTVAVIDIKGKLIERTRCRRWRVSGLKS